MSHVALVKVQIKDLDALAKACATLGLKLNLGQKTYKWYGTHVGDFPLPAGFKSKDLGTCDHAIVIPNKKGAYEIGVCKARDGSEGYVLLWDFWGGGFGLQDVVGDDCNNLVTEYTKNVARNEVSALAKNMGWAQAETYNEATGETTITLRKY